MHSEPGAAQEGAVAAAADGHRGSKPRWLWIWLGILVVVCALVAGLLVATLSSPRGGVVNTIDAPVARSWAFDAELLDRNSSGDSIGLKSNILGVGDDSALVTSFDEVVGLQIDFDSYLATLIDLQTGAERWSLSLLGDLFEPASFADDSYRAPTWLVSPSGKTIAALAESSVLSEASTAQLVVIDAESGKIRQKRLIDGWVNSRSALISDSDFVALWSPDYSYAAGDVPEISLSAWSFDDQSQATRWDQQLAVTGVSIGVDLMVLSDDAVSVEMSTSDGGFVSTLYGLKDGEELASFVNQYLWPLGDWFFASEQESSSYVHESLQRIGADGRVLWSANEVNLKALKRSDTGFEFYRADGCDAEQGFASLNSCDGWVLSDAETGAAKWTEQLDQAWHPYAIVEGQLLAAELEWADAPFNTVKPVQLSWFSNADGLADEGVAPIHIDGYSYLVATSPNQFFRYDLVALAAYRYADTEPEWELAVDADAGETVIPVGRYLVVNKNNLYQGVARAD